VTLCEDVALEVLATTDPGRARRFAADELGPLAGDGHRVDVLRETLEAYFASSLNANAAGARLGVHDQTVTYRLRRIEQLIGHPIYRRRAELELALRLERVLG
jgi:DNA-binding PucR family transcriptional regulator